MTYDFRPAKRENVPLLIGVAGGTGSGKTFSALLIAKGIAGDYPFAGVDTENRRMSHYADQFPSLHVAQMTAPFRPEKYTEAIQAAVDYLIKQGVPTQHRVVVVDSMSHEWAGDGGCLDWKDEITKGDDKLAGVAWAKIKPAHKKMLTRLLQVDAHLVLALRAEPKIEIVRRNGKLEFIPKESITGLDGWMPITEKMLPYELTASFLLMADAPGVPRPIKLEEQHKAFVPLDRPLSAETGRRLAEWAAGGDKVSAPGGVAVPAGEPADPDHGRVGSASVAGAEQSPFAAPAAAVEIAGQAHPPLGVNGISEAQAAYTLAAILETGERGVEFLKWAAGETWPDDFRANLDVFMQAHLPAVTA